MLDLKTIQSVLGEFEERGISKETMIDAIESAMATAYKKEYGKRGQVVRAKLSMDTGTVEFEQVKTVVDDTMVRFPTPEEEEAAEVPVHHPHFDREEETPEGELPRYDAEKHILLEDARRIRRGAELGSEIIFPLEPQDDFGRIAAQTAKQVVIQKIREAEKLSILDEFGGKKGEIVSGVVQRVERGSLFIDLGRATGVIPYEEQIPGERYRPGERIRAYLGAVDEGFRGVYLRLSRANPKYVVKLFELEAPELASGAIEVKNISREPGSRTKIALASLDPHVDPVGSLVGQRGVRVSTVMSELGGERIDIIEWSEDPKAYIKEALSPASVLDVELNDAEHRATVMVAGDQQSLAIGRGGQNVRLAARLTGWNIDIKPLGGTEEEVAAEATPEDAATPSEEADITPEEMPVEVTKDDSVANAELPAEEELTKGEEGEDSVVETKESRDEA
jgi:transcription termination/antitermination protein NusA